MRIHRFELDGAPHVGVETPAGIELLDGQLPDFRRTGRIVTPGRPLAPLVPTDILCIGLNYRAHAAESGSKIPEHPMLFIKASGALNDPDAEIVLPRLSDQVDYEGELAVVIARDARDVSPLDALDYVFAYTIANDVSARDWQRDVRLGGGQFARGKSFDGFCPLGPVMVTADEITDPADLRIITRLNGQVMQDSSCSDMIFDVRQLIASLSSTMTIRRGAVILTGTPSGVGFARKPPVFLRGGDSIQIDISPIGLLRNTVVGA